MTKELPKGWGETTLAQVTERVPNIKPEDYPDRKYGYVDISSIDNNSYRICEVKHFLGKDAPSRAKRPIQHNDVLFSNVRTYLRNIALVEAECPAQICSTGFTVLRPNSTVEPRYLFLYVLTNDFIDRVTPQQTGTHYPATSDRKVLSEHLPLPPLNEQRRIVAKLEALLAKVDDCKKRLERIPIILKRFCQSILAAACSGRLTEDWRAGNGIDNEWPVEQLESLFKMRNGKSLTVAKRKEGDVPVYGGNGFMGTHNKANVEGQIIIVGRVGAQCGNVHYVEGQAWITDNAISLQAKQKVHTPFYAFLLRSMNLNQLSGGTGQPYVSQEILGPLEAPIVELAEQQEIDRRVDELFSLADKLEARYNTAKTQVDKLTQSILAKAFRGELVPQDPNDEPASVLLERIRKNKVPSAGRRKRRKTPNVKKAL